LPITPTKKFWPVSLKLPKEFKLILNYNLNPGLSGIFYFSGMRKISLLLLVLITLSLSAQKDTSIVIHQQPFINGNDTIYGTLNIAGNRNKPLIVIIPGSGPTDRDGNSLIMSGKNNSYRMMADALLQSDISSLRYDKSGIGKSKSNRPETELRFEDNISSVQLILADLRKLGFNNIYLMGHSEGSLVAILTAQKEDVKGVISIAGPARNAADLIKSQLQSSPSLPDEMKIAALQKIDSIKEGHTVKKYSTFLASIFRPSVQPYLRSWFKYTPTEEIAKLTMPVLVIQGKQDSQVPAAAAEALDHYATTSKMIIYPKMNHVLKAIETEEENLSSYTNPDLPLQEGLVKDIVEWVNP